MGISIVSSKGRCVIDIDGRHIDVPGRSASISGGKVYVDGKLIEDVKTEPSDVECPKVNLTATNGGKITNVNVSRQHTSLERYDDYLNGLITYDQLYNEIEPPLQS